MAYDQTTQGVLDHLARYVQLVKDGERNPRDLIGVAEAVLRATSPEAVEDREYMTVDLNLPASERCGDEYGRWGRVCSRRDGHVSPTHRDLEFSWTDKMKENAR
jgi:hypothetical protein